MKTGIVTTLIALCLPVSVFATTLRLSTDVDLLVLDGKKVSSSLLRGADSIELDNGPHQLVFRVEKTIHLSNSEERLYISPPLVARRFFLHKNAINFALSEGAKKTHSAQCKNERKECLLMLLLSRITFVESRQADSIFESYITM